MHTNSPSIACPPQRLRLPQIWTFNQRRILTGSRNPYKTHKSFPSLLYELLSIHAAQPNLTSSRKPSLAAHRTQDRTPCSLAHSGANGRSGPCPGTPPPSPPEVATLRTGLPQPCLWLGLRDPPRPAALPSSRAQQPPREAPTTIPVSAHPSPGEQGRPVPAKHVLRTQCEREGTAVQGRHTQHSLSLVPPQSGKIRELPGARPAGWGAQARADTP